MEMTDKLEVTYKSLCMTIECPIELHNVKATAHIMVRLGKNETDLSLDMDIDDVDYQDIEFMGKKHRSTYENYKKFTASFKELTGMDIINEFDDYMNLHFPKETLLKYLIETNNTNL